LDTSQVKPAPKITIFKKQRAQGINMKKAQGLPLNTIIIAAMVLFVLFILVYTFSNQTKFFSKNLGGCLSKGGKCATTEGQCADQNYPISLYVSDECVPNKNMCCLPADNQQKTTTPQKDNTPCPGGILGC
jgi:hypothetical protein